MSDVYFHKFLVNRQVFFKSKHCYALVNLKPIIAGHVLLVPYRTDIQRFHDLDEQESIDYMKSLQLVSKFILWKYKADAMNISIQDGPESGQSVPHLHTHIIPRFKTDDLKNDKVHKELEKVDIMKDFEDRRNAFLHKPVVFRSDDERFDRTVEIMEKEALMLRDEFEVFMRGGE